MHVCITILVLLFHLVTVLLVCMMWLTATWGRVSCKVEDMSGNYTVMSGNYTVPGEWTPCFSELVAVCVIISQLLGVN